MTALRNQILVGDIGGTNTRLALADWHDGNIRIEEYEKFSGDDFSNLSEIIQTYLGRIETAPIAASLAIAGPVHNNAVKVTNRDWNISAKDLVARFGFGQVVLHNDFAAMSRSVLLMDEDSFELIHHSNSVQADAPILVAGSGTGFGVGLVLPCADQPHVIATEGGYQAYAPATPKECELLQILQRKYDYVPLELVASGSGLDAVHEAMCILHDQPYERLSPDTIRERASAGDPLCLDVCEIRSAAITSAAGDLALATGALGGVVLAGGVTERLVDYIRAPKALARFFDRGRRSDYMHRISIRLLNNPEAPLFGAAALFKDKFQNI